MKRLITELKSRLIYKFGVIYIAVAWLLTQVIVDLEEPLGLPEWVDTLVITLLALGLPIGLVFAWMHDRAAAAGGRAVQAARHGEVPSGTAATSGAAAPGAAASALAAPVPAPRARSTGARGEAAKDKGGIT